MCDSGASVICVNKSLTVILQNLPTPFILEQQRRYVLYFSTILSDERVSLDHDKDYTINIHYVQGFALKELLVLYLQYIYILYMGVKHREIIM
jgi:hypothetical protein